MSRWRWLAAASAAGIVVLLQPLPAQTQTVQPVTEPCPPTGQPLIRIPELVSKDRKLRGTILLGDEAVRMTFPGNTCNPQFVRTYRGVKAVLPDYPGAIPPGYPGAVPSKYPDPVPGPTLRARVGDLVELTFLNQIDTGHFGDSIDRGENAGACDEGAVGPSGKRYPESFKDEFPNCLHGSSTGNIHFHGTHTNPNSTGDNVFLQVRPSPRHDGKPTVTAASVKGSFAMFFANCEKNLRHDVLSEWPYTWKNLPAAWTQEQRTLLKAYDKGRPEAQQLWPPNAAQLKKGGWPQYYIGAYPICFQLPEYPPPAATPPPMPEHGLHMGQAPGTHWYHAHKHGSTALNVSNGMTGAFIIEGQYDDDLNAFYGEGWTRRQPVLVMNQLGVSPDLLRSSANGPVDISVNGRMQPMLSMKPGEVQLWRIVNTSSRSAAFFVGPPNFDPARPVDPKTDFQWMQLAQDGVQFADINYQNSLNKPFQMASGNRVDILIKAPTNPATAPYNVQIKQNVAKSSVAGAKAVTLMTVQASGTPPENPKQTEFIPKAPTFPTFLADVTDEEVRYNSGKTLTFDSLKGGNAHQHTIDGKQFDGTIGVSAFLNKAEEWKIENYTNKTNGPADIDHPFHIHINPFQIVEVFDPNEQVKDATGTLIAKYVVGTLQDPSVQCALNPDDKSTWKDCHNVKKDSRIWWDVFPIPSGRAIGTVTIPGYFRMRSRFVDFPGYYVLHCHILAHEDRGMMTVVEVRSNVSPVQHH